MKPLVSVIIPTYKSCDTLCRAIQSVLNQTYDNIEVIVVDDNNPNTPERAATEELMLRYKTESEVHYIKHEFNKNGSAARNTGFRHSSGEYLCFLDDDDYFLKDKLQLQVEYMQSNPQYDANYCWRIDRGKEVCGKCGKCG